ESVRLVIVGDGPLRQEIERSTQMLSSPSPLLLGYRPDVERFYGTFDAFVLNSFAEGMSNTLLEAMASGLPIVCTAVGGNVELVTNNARGILISSGDDSGLALALRELMGSRQRCNNLAVNAREFAVGNLSLAGMIQRYTGLYESVTQ